MDWDGAESGQPIIKPRIKIDVFGDKTTTSGGTSGSTTKQAQTLETLSGVCDGRVIQGESASYTFENVLGPFNTSATWTKITGSGISYKPPTGTKQVIFELFYAFKGTGSGSFEPLFATKLKIGSSYVEGQEYCFRDEFTGGYPEAVVSNKFILDINSSHTESITNGKLSSWDTNRDLQVDIRTYVGYAVKIHALRHDDASLDGGSSGYFRAPLLKITAIGEGTVGGGSSQWTTNSDDIHYNSGNVGIGTTSPHQKLTVRASSGTNYDGICLETNADHRRINMASSGSGGTGNAYLQMWGSDNNSSSETQNKILLHTGGDSYFNGGNVGIGTTSPDYALEIVNSGTGSGVQSNTATIYAGNSYFYSNHTNQMQACLKTSTGIWCGGEIMVTSDSRIKENIVDVPDTCKSIKVDSN